MQPKVFHQAKELASYCRLFSNPIRVMIMWLLACGEYSVGDLADVLHASIQNASQHLQILKAHGYVQSRRKGSVVYYALTLKAVEDDSGFLTSRNPLISKGSVFQTK